MKKSAGIVLYKKESGQLKLFLVRPGGPFWKNKDQHAWSIPKGEFNEKEDPFRAAKREFHEETGKRIEGGLKKLRKVKQPGGKVIFAWAVEGDIDEESIQSNQFEMEWPPRTGKKKQFPEVDKGAWFTPEEAKEKIHKGQVPIVEQLVRLLDGK